jgi:hypothetical protein
VPFATHVRAWRVHLRANAPLCEWQHPTYDWVVHNIAESFNVKHIRIFICRNVWHFSQHSHTVSINSFIQWCSITEKKDSIGRKSKLQKKTSVALSPHANYTDWATATCWRNLVPTFVDRGVSRGQRGGSPSFLDRNPNYSIFK